MNNNDFPDLEKDVLERSTAELPEKKFIQEPLPPKGGQIPLWVWFTLFTMFIALIWGSMGWFQGVVTEKIQKEPFLEVTNREFSQFLWQFSAFMKAHAKEKTGYLPAFRMENKEILDPKAADEWVTAPPEVLFLYHTWHRLIGDDYIPRPIPQAEFVQFMNQVKIWQPEYWKSAPKEYVEFINSRLYEKVENLQTLPETTLPKSVRIAFQGWKNYFIEGDQVNNLIVTISDVKKFIEKYPAYARNYWRNIEQIGGREVAGSQYLLTLLRPPLSLDEPFPEGQVPPFLKVALFNELERKKIQ